MLIKIDNKELYFNYLQSLPVAIVVADAKSRLILHFNGEAEHLWLKKSKDMIGQPQTILHSDYWNEQGRETFSKNVKILEDGGVVKQTINGALRSDGREIPIQISAIMIEIDSKRALVGAFTSIEEREKAFNLLKNREDELNAIFENSQVGIMYLKGGRYLMKSNQRLADIFGYKNSDEMKGISMDQIHLSHERFEWFGKHHYEPLKRNESIHIQYQMKKKNGESIWVSLSGKAIDVDSPADLDKGVIWIVDDISGFKEFEEKIQNSNHYLESIIDGVNESLMVIKEDYSVEIMNKHLRDNISNVHIADMDNIKCYEISHNRSTPCDGENHPCPIKQAMESKKYVKVMHKHYAKNGSDMYVELAATPLLDANNNCTGIIESSRDVTEYLKTLNELQVKTTLLDFQAHHDILTGLPNRTLYHDRVEQAIQKVYSSKQKFVLLFIDIDHFKQINDSLGHVAGDEILLQVSKRLKSILRDGDTLARFGGDEFALLFESIDRIQDVTKVAQNILNLFSDSFNILEHNLYLSCSIGISIFPDDAKDAESLLSFADNAMYKAKDEGRNNFQFYTRKMTELAFEHIVLESALRQAIKDDDLIVFYQPQYNAKTNKIVGLEALVRWQHHVLGLILPSKFIPLAEETGLIVELDRWVMKQAMKRVAKWYEDGYNPGLLSLNLAVKQLESEDFLDELKSLIKETSFKVEWLKLEILESDVMRRPEENIKKLQAIRDLGIRIAIDDFGTGHSSLTYLKRFPIDQLKIDQSFVRDLDNDKVDDALVLAIIALAKALRLETIAEGVETKGQLDFLVQNGCYYIQGYYFSRPVDEESIKKLLEDDKL